MGRRTRWSVHGDGNGSGDGESSALQTPKSKTKRTGRNTISHPYNPTPLSPLNPFLIPPHQTPQTNLTPRRPYVSFSSPTSSSHSSSSSLSSQPAYHHPYTSRENFDEEAQTPLDARFPRSPIAGMFGRRNSGYGNGNENGTANGRGNGGGGAERKPRAYNPHRESFLDRAERIVDWTVDTMVRFTVDQNGDDGGEMDLPGGAGVGRGF
ncbi:hypothetical protein K402DRAFT_389454 [Aulographum hederae CBS 113979]|uniref:Uncharacterized protein n=1 Tax=Aulographum hederae CBS 113979 TaxID=1176131 RepID=A0A6G1HDH4_9PEZI|nr:hypothetical protein K402DRAFT_389454 [Aulographum hederae CBS 113979]